MNEDLFPGIQVGDEVAIVHPITGSVIIERVSEVSSFSLEAGRARYRRADGLAFGTCTLAGRATPEMRKLAKETEALEIVRLREVLYEAFDWASNYDPSESEPVSVRDLIDATNAVTTVLRSLRRREGTRQATEGGQK